MMAESATALVRVEQVTKRFRQGDSVVEALKNVSLTVESGEFVAVMGASGSGKSTLLHVLAGLTRPEEGGVTIDGQNLLVLSDRQLTQFRRRRIGLVFQAFNLVASLSAADNILLPLFCDGMAGGGEKADALLKRLELTSRRQHRPDALSGGEQQRVAIARALIADPALILADEPTGSLDSINGQKLCRLLRELCEEQRRTIVLVTHEPAVAIWAQRVVVLRDGQILTQFKTADFADAHALAAHYQSVVEVKPGAEVG